MASSLRNTKKDSLARFLKRISYVQGNSGDPQAYDVLRRHIEKLVGATGDVVFYLATPPEIFGAIAKHLGQAGLNKSNGAKHILIIEKPFGSDLESSRKLQREISSAFNESQVFRIDHYLGKELIQNILILRFTNSLFEHLCTSQYVDHVQITVAEEIGVEDRAEYYDKSGALRDMIQNHLLQVLCLIAMEPPVSLDASDIRAEKVKVLRAIERFSQETVSSNVVRSQYEGYRKEKGVHAASRTETFVALKTEIQNLRWSGVPFYLRTGKQLRKSFAEVNIVLKDLPCVLFCTLPSSKLHSNRITIKIQPDEGIAVQFNTKTPGALGISPQLMEFCHACQIGPTSPKAYENLLRNALAGDQTLFTSWEEVEEAWKLIDPILSAWKKSKKLSSYKGGSMGPREADELLKRDNRTWINK